MTTQTATAHRFILETFAKTGRSPGLEQIRDRFGLDNTGAAEALVSELEQTGSIHRNAGDAQITHAYPFSNEPTAHRVHLETAVEVYSMCAVDALGIPFMLKQDGEIRSVCAHCGAGVRVAISAGQVSASSPDGLVVWFPQARQGCVAATDLCPAVNFFCTAEHVEAWKQDQPDHSGELLSLEQAVERGRVIFERLMPDKD